MQFFTWRSAILKSTLPSTTKLVLLVLSTYMDDHGGGCFPSMETIAINAGLSKRAVVTQIRVATDAGFISVSKHGYGGQKWARNQYQIAFPAAKAGEPASPRLAKKAVNDVHQPVNKGSEPISPPIEKVVNGTTKGGERHDTKAVNDVHSISPVNSPQNSPVKQHCSDLPCARPDGSASRAPTPQMPNTFRMNVDWKPGTEFGGFLLRAGIPQSYAWEDELLDFGLYWREQPTEKTQGQWELRFIKHVQHNRRYAESQPQPISPHWAPPQNVYDVLIAKDVDIDFAEHLVPEFVLYWSDAGTLQRSWSTKFIEFVVSQFRIRKQQVEASSKNAFDRLTDRSWAEGHVDQSLETMT